ncbi:hypothetical protein PCANC_23159 [Puccinia coronata f. sp. avenae]|uniref:Phytochrome n=1 Tax=Puccinia coronata f. sp. avenae TaxID=200324 RepID=A0A2N5SB31_9BASI|nr:hypothetical protein PCANC_23159 [Puccinia coronata f. sp. avenae]
MAQPTQSDHHVLHRHPPHQSSSSPILAPSTNTLSSSSKNSSNSPSFKEPLSFDSYPLLHQLDLTHHHHHHHHHHHSLPSSPLDSSVTRSLDSESLDSSSYPPVSESSPHSPFHSPTHSSFAQLTPSLTPKKSFHQLPSTSSQQHAHAPTPLTNTTTSTHHPSLPAQPAPHHPVDPQATPTLAGLTTTTNHIQSQPLATTNSTNPNTKTYHRVFPIKSLVKVKNTPNPNLNLNLNPSPPSSPSPASDTSPIRVISKPSNEPSSPISLLPFKNHQSSPKSPDPFSPHRSPALASTHHRPGSIGSNSSGFSSSNRSRRADCLPPIAEQTSSNGSEPKSTHERASSQESQHKLYNDVMGIGRPRRSSSTRFSLTNSKQPSSSPMQSSPSHSRQMSLPATKHHQSPASMLMTLGGLSDFNPSDIAAFNNSRPPSATSSHDSFSPSGTVPPITLHPLSDVSNRLELPDDPANQNPSSSSDPSPQKPGYKFASSTRGQVSHGSLISSDPEIAPTLIGPKQSGPNLPIQQETSYARRGPPTIEKPVSVAGRSHATTSAVKQSSISDPSQCSSPPTIISDPDAYFTTRFEYQQNDDELLILTGRKGEFTKCEDEPIRIPGAIQAFGVLVAVMVHGDSRSITIPRDHPDFLDSINEMPSMETSSSVQSDEELEELINISRLEVVQVSENSRHILGLSPKLLLNLFSFTEVLTQSQSQVLCDNLEVCLDGGSSSTAGPHTFRLTGRGGIGTGIDGPSSHAEWSCWCAAHRPDPASRPRLVIIEFELEHDELNPPSTVSAEPVDEGDRGGVAGKPYEPTEQDLMESTMSINKPLKALARLRRKGKDFSGDNVEVLSILSQLNTQFDAAQDMPTFLKMAVGLVRELTGFDRVMIYKFDEAWNGQVVAELVDWKRTRDLYRGLRFPASDIPAQARELYKINKVRMLYDRDQPTARLMCKSQEELHKPLNMTHCHLRAMSPIHIKYLANMGVRSSFSISIILNDELWGLISCHSYGRFGQRVTFPTRQFCAMLGDTVSRNILRLNLSQRLQSRKLINTTSTSKNPSGYIVAKAEDLLWLFDAQSGVLSIGEEAKILGTVSNSQEILAILEYLRVTGFDSIQFSTDINRTFPNIEYPGGFESISGLLVIPLSRSGQDFICFFRPAQSKEIHWAGNPHEKVLKTGDNPNMLEPRKSFKIWSETVREQSKAWTEEQLETGSVLSLVYGKFIDVWRQKEAAVQNNQLQALLLSNASHEVRTPLHQILSTLELALDGQLDEDTRDNLSKSYSASRALVHVINDLLDLTKAEQGGDLFSRDPFDLPSTLEEAVSIHQREAERKGLVFEMVEGPDGAPATLQGDRARLRQVVSNLVGNAVKHTTKGHIHVQWGAEYDDTQEHAQEQSLLAEEVCRISVAVTDTGKGIPEAQLENIFRAFEQVGSGESQDDRMCESIGLGLAVVGRVVHNMGGQLRVDSTVNQGSKFTITLPFVVPPNTMSRTSTTKSSGHSSNVRSIGSDSIRGKPNGKVSSSRGSHTSHHGSIGTSSSGIDDLVEAISGSSGRNSVDTHFSPRVTSPLQPRSHPPRKSVSYGSTEGSKDSSSSHSLGSAMGGQVPHRRISSASHQDLFNKAPSSADNFPEPQRTPAQAQPASESQRKVPDRSSKPKKAPPQNGMPKKDKIKSEAAVPSQPPSTESTIKPKHGKRSSPSKIDRPSFSTIQEPPQPSSSTHHPLPSSPHDHRERQNPLSPSPLEHISEYQKPDRSQTPVKQPMKVMVVEDDPINRLILKKKLTMSGHSVSLTVHGQEAIELFERDPSKFDIILMDLQMPICDGIEATKKIREFERTSLNPSETTDKASERTQDSHSAALLPKSHQVNFGVPIIAVSASLHERQREDIFKAGMDGWILKPVDFNRLATLMIASIDVSIRAGLVYKPGTWDQGGWLCLPKKSARNPDRK